ncbi:MAG: tyrosine--tRNA ligase [Bacteroidales bacterium]|jgi:tyrosyl-tRNA synthetase|nr:tyrosine--tRNA ligase [Bacteroidales bacterium]NPV35596.1 tyrosine--tRNA ligase [Bacteroidales bacterium]
MKNFVEELRWRGMVHDMMPGTEEYLMKGPAKGYIGFDPTADSLHIGHLVQIMTLVHFQRCGHIPIALVGGATGMVGDPSGKSEERNLLSREQLEHNLAGIKKQLEKFIDFDAAGNAAIMVNNYNWFKGYEFLDFIRDIGKHITVNYMLAKDSVQKRLENGMSFTEFSYQLVQGYDFYWLYKNMGCRLQMGGSDQWGNIVTGTELIRRKDGGEAYALTTPLLKKADGSKFGKTASGALWLDPQKTTPYAFYQYWINTADEDAANFIRIFTTLEKEEIDGLIEEHNKAPHLRVLQKALAKDITIRVHSEADYQAAVEASEILFGRGTTEMLGHLDENTLLSVFEGVPQFHVARTALDEGIPAVDFLAVTTAVFPSKGEARRMMKDGGVSINKLRISEETIINTSHLLQGKYILVQKGKKNYFLVIAG